MTRPRVVAVVAAYQEGATIARTVEEILALQAVDEVVVAADGCRDRTAAEAARAGARVLVSSDRRGKGRAVEAAVDRTPRSDVYLLVDGDVGETAGLAGRLLSEVVEGRLDLAVGRLPALPGGGFGIVRRMSAFFIQALTGLRVAAPLSGQRAVLAPVLAACGPLAGGFGLETAMTIDAGRLGFRIGEVDVDMTHRRTGRGFRGFWHRGRQGLDILRAVLPRALRLR